MKRALRICLGLVSLGAVWVVLPASDGGRRAPAPPAAGPAAARPPAARWLDVTPRPIAPWPDATSVGGLALVALAGPMPPPGAGAPVPPPLAAADPQVATDRDPHELVETEAYPPGDPRWRIPPERSRQMQLDNEREARARPRAEPPADPQVAELLAAWAAQFDQLRDQLRAEGHADVEAELARRKDRFFSQRRNP